MQLDHAAEDFAGLDKKTLKNRLLLADRLKVLDNLSNWNYNLKHSGFILNTVRFLMKRIKKICFDIHRYVVNSGRRSEQHYKFLGVLGVFGFPTYYIIWKFIFPQPYENFWLRILLAALCLAIALYQKWPKKFMPILPYFWFISLVFILPFYFNFMLLANHMNTIWLMSSMAGLFILILVVDWPWMLGIFIAGTTLAWIIFITSGGNPNLLLTYMGYMAIYVFIGIVGALFIANTGRLQKEKLEAMASLSGNVAHELRTPLLGLKGAIAGFKKYLPILQKAYLVGMEQKLELPKIRRIHLQNLMPALDRMDSEIHFANSIIDMLLMNVGKNKIDPKSFEFFNVADSVDVMLDRYPFDSAELEAKIHWDKTHNFTYKGVPLLFEHVLFNLMKNALHFIVKADKGEIFIWLRQGKNDNYLHFKDTGQGISPAVMPHLFERFFTTTLTGTGIGLSFCKMVMKSFGGNIFCRSQEGEYAEFILQFPKVKDETC